MGKRVALSELIKSAELSYSNSETLSKSSLNEEDLTQIKEVKITLYRTLDLLTILEEQPPRPKYPIRAKFSINQKLEIFRAGTDLLISKLNDLVNLAAGGDLDNLDENGSQILSKIEEDVRRTQEVMVFTALLRRSEQQGRADD
jgi:DUF438 domain-containing protein